jgi:hypothetical protein
VGVEGIITWAEHVVLVFVMAAGTRGIGANGADGAVCAVGAGGGAVARQADALSRTDGIGWCNLAGGTGPAEADTLGEVNGASSAGGVKRAGLAGLHGCALREGADRAQLTLAHVSCTVAGLAHTLAGELPTGPLDRVCSKAVRKRNHTCEKQG